MKTALGAIFCKSNEQRCTNDFGGRTIRQTDCIFPALRYGPCHEDEASLAGHHMLVVVLSDVEAAICTLSSPPARVVHTTFLLSHRETTTYGEVTSTDSPQRPVWSRLSMDINAFRALIPR